MFGMETYQMIATPIKVYLKNEKGKIDAD
jgi:hypothetical protein